MLPKLFFIIISTLISSFTFTNSHTQCLHHQKTLLLQLKDELNFNSSLSTKLVRWNESDECCKWHGVECDAAGYVVSLQLDNESISGGIADSSMPSMISTTLAFRKVPLQLSFLRRLVCLDISHEYSDSPSLELPNLEMLVQNLTGLRELYLGGVNVTSSDEKRNWIHIISSYLPNLTTLRLTRCGLSGPLAKSFGQLHSLSFLRLDMNDLGTELPDLFANFPSLTTLSLFKCGLKGSIPPTFANLTNLILVDLSSNSFTGALSSTLFEGLSNLVYLDLRGNSFSGNIPHSLFALPSLLELDLSGNKFNGTLKLDKCQNLANLTRLDLSYNRLSVDVGNVDSTSYGSLQLKELGLVSCNLSHFPNFIKYLDMERVDLSDNRIGGEIPNWIWGTQLVRLDLSFNLLTDLQKPYHIPSSLRILHLDSNQLKGELHLHIPPASPIWYLSLANNSLSGSIPTSLCSPTNLVVGNNNITDSFPCMLSSSRWLQLLVLRSNKFHGEVRCHDKSWSKLQILDISSNHFSGNLESINFSSWKTMMLQSNEELRYGNTDYFAQLGFSLTLIMKGINSEYRKIWSEFGTIDFSCNNFGGDIPNAIGDLTSLHQLNFSHNALNGSIPNSFGRLRNLESLDLSGNRLTGLIPVELAGLTFLQVLNLSYNKLVGEIPHGRQFQTFSADSFKGNAGLCGFNLNISCSIGSDGSDHLSPEEDDNGEEKREIEWEYVSAALGYVVGLGIIVWLLLFSRSFREKYFGKVEEVFEDICDARIRRKGRRRHARRVIRNQLRRQ